MLFSDVKYALSTSFPTHRLDELVKILDANGATKATVDEASHVITSTLQFEGREAVASNVNIVTDEWVDRCIVHGKLQDPNIFSADPNMIFSGVIACASDLEACDKEVVSAGINALGGLFREGYTRDCTHVLAPRPGSDKYSTAMHYKPATRVHVVLPHWFDDCFKLFTRLPEDPYAWPDPPLLRADQKFKKARLPDATRSLVKADVLAEKPDQAQVKALVATQTDIWHGKRVLLSSSLELERGRCEAVEVSIQRAGGLLVPLSDDEAVDIDCADVYITQYRTGSIFAKAVRANKTVGTLSWLFSVHKTCVVSRPQDQLLHFPTRREPVKGFSEHKITATNYEGDARRYLKKLIELMGAEFTPQMTSSNTVVVAAFIGGDKTTKAREWNIPIVNHTWLEDCFLAWSILTPAQEKRGIEPLSEDELLESERADDERKRTAEAIIEGERSEKGRIDKENKEKDERKRLDNEKHEKAEQEESERRRLMTVGKPKTPIISKSKLSLLDDDLDTSSEDGFAPFEPIQGRSKPPQPVTQLRKGKGARVHSEDEAANTKWHVQKAQKSGTGPSRGTISENLKTSLRKQSSISGPTLGKTVAVEIVSPRNASSTVARTRSLVSVAADAVFPQLVPKRGKPRGRPRTMLSPESGDDGDSPLSSSRSSEGLKFSEEAIRRSSVPTPIVGPFGIQRTPSRRQAATKATMRLHQIAPDILNFQKEMRNGLIRGPWEDNKGKGKETDGGKKRRASGASGSRSDESGVEEVDTRDKKKRKIKASESTGRKGAIKGECDTGIQPPSAKKSTKKPRISRSVSIEEEDDTQNARRETSNAIDPNGIRLMTTQLTLSENEVKGLRQLGVKITSKPSECTLLMANSIGRTEKFLCAMATTHCIVNQKWATDSVLANKIMNPESYFLKDPEGEKKHGIKLSESLQRAQSSSHRLLDGQTFYFTKTLRQSDRYGTYKNVILSAGGKVSNGTKSYEDKAIWQGLADEGFHIYIAEFILIGVLAQKMEWGSKAHRLDNNL
ncbi:hypothetical protein EW145_g2052 [Phellinidium pouzarii]|uniref:BRCT domain-containing protein n=1 Tax=Phellinidium pouzarii TaxID=167371 RepID=A0A4S4LCT4_9AGAM|nr:hypothetical protein EW145_g2052 [Phellinidium pouzarii]